MRTGKRRRKQIGKVSSLSLELTRGKSNIIRIITCVTIVTILSALREWIAPAVATWILDKLVHGLNNSGKRTNCIRLYD